MHRLTYRPTTAWVLVAIVVTLLATVAVAVSLHFHLVDGAPGAASVQAIPGVGGSNPAAAPATGSAAKFRFLAAQTSNSCGLQQSTVMSYADGQRIQGSCCNPMDMGKYSIQTRGLRQYAAITRIPQDPYDVPASLAKQLLGDDQAIHLNATQQGVYDQAMTMTKDKAPCCCHCWRWDATAGLAKYLISERSWRASDVAHVVDLVNGCGGPA